MKARKEIQGIYALSLSVAIVALILTYELNQGLGWIAGWIIAAAYIFCKLIQWGAFND